MKHYILAIDQGTTSSRAIVYAVARGSTPGDAPTVAVVGAAQEEFRQHFPQNGWVEHDPEDIWGTVLRSSRAAIANAALSAKDIACIGITNQRETALVWDRATGKPIYNAIVWQDRRTGDTCRQMVGMGLEPLFRERTGLLLDPYFSATKVRWMLDNVSGARNRAEQGQLLFGTVDTYLLWRLTGGKVHATDATNASRTLMFNIHSQSWDPDLLRELDIPAAMLPDVRDTAAEFGQCDAGWLGSEIPICSLVGDQQAALIGQACYQPGTLKSTYGTGCFAVVNTGSQAVTSQHRLLTTVGYRLHGRTTYALEGSIFMAGAIMQWLRDGLGLIKSAADSEQIAQGLPFDQSEIMVPAFTGLGAPYWDPDARAAIFGMTRDTGVKQIVAAAINSVALQTEDLLRAMIRDGIDIKGLRVDGGMTENHWFLQVLASVTGIPTLTSDVAEATAKGAALLAGLQCGIFRDLDQLAGLWRARDHFQPALSSAERDRLYKRWCAAVAKVRSNTEL